LIAPASAAEATCSRPVSNAEALYIISNQLSGNRQAQAYWWSKTDLTIGIEASPTVDPDHYAAAERAIRTWQTTIDQCLGGEVTLTYVAVQPGSLSGLTSWSTFRSTPAVWRSAAMPSVVHPVVTT